MKNFLLVIIGGILAAGLIYVGWLFGARTHFMEEALSHTIAEKSVTDLVMKEAMLVQLQEGKIQDVKNSIRMEVDGNILEVDAFRDDVDAKHQELFHKILTKIAQDRKRFTNDYTGNLPQMDAEVEAKINSILKQANESQTNK